MNNKKPVPVVLVIGPGSEHVGLCAAMAFAQSDKNLELITIKDMDPTKDPNYVPSPFEPEPLIISSLKAEAMRLDTGPSIHYTSSRTYKREQERQKKKQGYDKNRIAGPKFHPKKKRR